MSLPDSIPKSHKKIQRAMLKNNFEMPLSVTANSALVIPSLPQRTLESHGLSFIPKTKGKLKGEQKTNQKNYLSNLAKLKGDKKEVQKDYWKEVEDYIDEELEDRTHPLAPRTLPFEEASSRESNEKIVNIEGLQMFDSYQNP